MSSPPKAALAHRQEPMGDIATEEKCLEVIDLSKISQEDTPPIAAGNTTNVRLTPPNTPNSRANVPPDYMAEYATVNGQNVRYVQNLDGQRVYVVASPQNLTRGRRERLIENPRGERNNRDVYYVETNQEIFAYSFTSTKIRNRFVRKVYLILCAMLLFTFGFIMMVTFIDPLRQFFIQGGLIILIVFMIIYMAASLTIICCSGVARRVPINYILLGVVAFSFTMVMAVMCAMLPYQIILMAIGTTAGVCLIVSLFAIQTRWDVTGCGTCLCIITLIFMVFGIVMMIISLCGIFIKPLHIVFAGFGALLFSFWLMYDTQQIVGGRRYEISTEEYAFAALTLYVDVMLIFMYILDLYALCFSG